MTHLPEKWSERQYLIVLTQHEAVTKENARLPDGTLIVTAPYFEDDERIIRLERHGLLKPGALLVLNPMNRDSYVLDEDADVRLAAEKALHFSHLCQLLGANRVKVTSQRDATRDTDVRAEATGGARGVTGGLEIHGADAESLSQSIDLEIEFPGSDEPDLAEARTLLEDTGLAGDSTLVSLVESRAHRTNPVLKRVLTVDLTAECRGILEGAVKARTALGAQAGGKAARSAKKSSAYRVTYEVQFPKPVSGQPVRPDADHKEA